MQLVFTFFSSLHFNSFLLDVSKPQLDRLWHVYASLNTNNNYSCFNLQKLLNWKYVKFLLIWIETFQCLFLLLKGAHFFVCNFLASFFMMACKVVLVCTILLSLCCLSNTHKHTSLVKARLQRKHFCSSM